MRQRQAQRARRSRPGRVARTCAAAARSSGDRAVAQQVARARRARRRSSGSTSVAVPAAHREALHLDAVALEREDLAPDEAVADLRVLVDQVGDPQRRGSDGESSFVFDQHGAPLHADASTSRCSRPCASGNLPSTRNSARAPARRAARAAQRSASRAHLQRVDQQAAAAPRGRPRAQRPQARPAAAPAPQSQRAARLAHPVPLGRRAVQARTLRRTRGRRAALRRHHWPKRVMAASCQRHLGVEAPDAPARARAGARTARAPRRRSGRRRTRRPARSASTRIIASPPQALASPTGVSHSMSHSRL